MSGLAPWVLQDARGAYRYDELVNALAALPAGRLVAAPGVTVAGYSVLVGDDLLAFRFIGRSKRQHRDASLVANALANNLGKTLFTGAAIRH